MEIVADDRWCFFASKFTDLRVNISPDLTVATLDFIHTEIKSIPLSIPCVGQPKLPICLKFCGFGTYFSPWYIDTNDVMLQSISHVSEVCIFIDKAWINFIMELNFKIRNLRRHCLASDLIIFMQNLLEEKLVGSLGGVITQFCCFVRPNASQNDAVVDLISNSKSSDGHELGNNEDRHSLDTVIFQHNIVLLFQCCFFESLFECCRQYLRLISRTKIF